MFARVATIEGGTSTSCGGWVGARGCGRLRHPDGVSRAMVSGDKRLLVVALRQPRGDDVATTRGDGAGMPEDVRGQRVAVDTYEVVHGRGVAVPARALGPAGRGRHGSWPRYQRPKASPSVRASASVPYDLQSGGRPASVAPHRVLSPTNRPGACVMIVVANRQGRRAMSPRRRRGARPCFPVRLPGSCLPPVPAERDRDRITASPTLQAVVISCCPAEYASAVGAVDILVGQRG